MQLTRRALAAIPVMAALPAEHGEVDALHEALWRTGIDGLFSDFTALSVAAPNRVYPA